MGRVSLCPEAVRRQLGPRVVLVNGGFFKCRGRRRATGGEERPEGWGGHIRPLPLLSWLTIQHTLSPTSHCLLRQTKGQNEPRPSGAHRPRSRSLGSEWCVLVLFSVAPNPCSGIPAKGTFPSASVTPGVMGKGKLTVWRGGGGGVGAGGCAIC